VSLALLSAVTALLLTWGALRRRRIQAAWAAGPSMVGDSSLASAPLLRSRPGLAHLGLNPLAWRFVAASAAVLAADVTLFSAYGLTLDWSTVWMGELILSALLIAWLNFYFVPGSPKEWFVAEVLLLTFLLVAFTNVVSPMQYGAVAVGGPYADWWLAAADARMGAHVPTLAAWTRNHPVISLLAMLTYDTFMPQMVLTLFVLAALRERERLWEFAFHFHVCLLVAVAALLICPAVCPPAYYGFTPTIDMTHLIAQIKGFHDGTMTVVRFNELEGLVSFPSFHVAGGIIVTWAFRDRRRILIPLMILNAAMVISTFITGVHYVIDVAAALPLFAGSVAAYRWWGRGLLSSDGVPPA
jgi:PAP2 superfamily